MISITKNDKVKFILLTVIGLSTFLFFLFVYPYHLLHKEQICLFLFSTEFVNNYFKSPGIIGNCIGDFLTQFFYLRLLGPFIVTIVFSFLAWVTYSLLSKFRNLWISIIGTLIIYLYEVWRFCGLSYPLSSSVSTIGYIFILWIWVNYMNNKWKWINIIPLLVIAYFSFGIAPFKYLKPRPINADREYILSLYNAHYEEKPEVINILLEKDHELDWASYFYNLSNAGKGTLSDKLLEYYQPGLQGLFIPIGPSSSYLSIMLAGEVWFEIGDLTFAEHCAMLSMIFSPGSKNAHSIKRLAEINLIRGDERGALKYLRILEKTFFYRDWAKERMISPLSDNIKEEISKKRKLCSSKDDLREVNNVVPSLVNLLESNPDNIMAYNYLLCYVLVAKDLNTFMDYLDNNKIMSKLYSEAALIKLTQSDELKPENIKKYQISSQLLKDFQRYMDIYNKTNGNPFILEKEFDKTYWFYYHFRTLTK